ncbi:RNA methyltransferase [bacterium]|nr:RNA methyltransferase [bacterium]
MTDALSRGMSPAMTAVTPGYADAHGQIDFPHVIMEQRLLERIADTATPQGILAFFPVPWVGADRVLAHEKVVILDGVQDPGNVGTIIRTAEAFGFSGILITEGTASPFSPKALRSAMGSTLGVDIARIDRKELKRIPHRIISLAPLGTAALSRELFSAKTAVCLGQEGAGVSGEVMALSHVTVSIPMKGSVESLNVSVAAGIVLAYAAGAV